MLAVYILSPTVFTFSKVTNAETLGLDGSATIVAALKDGPTAAASTISGGGSIAGSLRSGTTADYTVKVPAGLALTLGHQYWLHVNINSSAGYFVIPVRAETAPTA